MDMDLKQKVNKKQNGYGTANEGAAAMNLNRNGQHSPCHSQTATMDDNVDQIHSLNAINSAAAVTSSNLNTPISQSTTSVDDPFHCHNRVDERPKITNASSKRATRVLWLSVVVCLFFMICEVVGGLWAQSLAIITDAAHLLTDLASMLISLFSIYLASRPASQRMSFGWHRAEVVGAFISVFMIWVVTAILVYLAIDRMITAKYDINANIMSITAAVGVAVNIIMGILLYMGGHSHTHGHGHSHGGHRQQQHLRRSNGTIANGAGERQPLVHSEEEGCAERSPGEGYNHETNINVRAAFIHVLGDLIQSIGVLIAGLLIFWKPDWQIIDPICTLIFSLIVLSTTMYIIRDALVVLLEGRPSSIDFRLVFNALETIEGVKKVHDLRIWALTMNKVAISVHLEIDPTADSQQILKATTQMLRRDFNVHESTIQIEGYLPEAENCYQCIVPSK